MIGVVRNRIQIRQHFVHATEFVEERNLHLLIRQALDAELQPIHQFFDYIKRLLVVTLLIGI